MEMAFIGPLIHSKYCYRCFTYIISFNPTNFSLLVLPYFQMRKLKLREVKWLAQAQVLICITPYPSLLGLLGEPLPQVGMMLLIHQVHV